MYRLRPDVRLRGSADGSSWAFRLDNGEHFEINETARVCLEALARDREPQAIARELASKYDVDSAQAEADVLAIIELSVQQGLVEREA